MTISSGRPFRFTTPAEGGSQVDEGAHGGVAGHFARQGATYAIADDVKMRIRVIAKTILIICPLAAGVGCRRKRQRQCG